VIYPGLLLKRGKGAQWDKGEVGRERGRLRHGCGGRVDAPE